MNHTTEERDECAHMERLDLMQADGAKLTEAELEFTETHLACCDACALEERALGLLRHHGQSGPILPLSGLQHERFVDEVLARAASKPRGAEKWAHLRRYRGASLAAACLLLSVGAGVLLLLKAEPPSPGEELAVKAEPGAEVNLLRSLNGGEQGASVHTARRPYVNEVRADRVLAPAEVDRAASPSHPPGRTKPHTSPSEQRRPDMLLKGMEQRIFRTKEEVFRAKQRLTDLKAALIGERLGNRLVIRQKNQMSSSFRLVRMEYNLDGQPALTRARSLGHEDLDVREQRVLDRAVEPGAHTLAVRLVYRGHGRGIFPYLEGYKFTIRSSHSFNAGGGKQTRLLVTAYKKGDFTTPMEDQPGLKFEVSSLPLSAPPDE